MGRITMVIAAVAMVAGCGTVRNEWTKIKAGVVTLDTNITLYNCKGDTIETWHTHANVETAGGEAWWVGEDGTQHHISGTFVVRGR